MQGKELTAFFDGAYDSMCAAYKASSGLSSASRGAARERAARDLFTSIIPPAIRIVTGDIVDSRGTASGQLDGIVIEGRAPALKLAASSESLVLAESAIAVLEFKSDLSRQWNEVEDKFGKVAALRPALLMLPRESEFEKLLPRSLQRKYRDKVQALIYGVRAEQKRIHFFVFGHKGWADPRELLGKVEGLARLPSAKKRSPMVVAVTLDPPTIAVRSDKHGAKVMQPADPGEVIGMPWFMLVVEAERLLRFRRIPWARYVGGPRTAELQGTSHIDWITQEPLAIDD